MKQKTFLIADGETTGIGKRAYLFDFAYTIATRNATLLERSFLVRDVITNPRVMLGAYFNDSWREMMGGKIFRDYIPAIARQDMALYSWREIVETMRDDMATHNVAVFCAYNLRFDMGAIATTQAYTGRQEKVLPYRPDLLCLWEFACNTVCQTRLYHDVARQRGFDWITDANNVRTNAEKVYAFLTGNLDFVEAHTALADAQIETEILQRLLAKKKRIPYNELDYMPWRKAQRIF
jgi:hypothetical protein